MPPMNSNAMEHLCKKIYEAVSNKRQMKAMLHLFSDMIKEAEKELEHHETNGNPLFHIKDFTSLLQKKIETSKI